MLAFVIVTVAIMLELGEPGHAFYTTSTNLPSSSSSYGCAYYSCYNYGSCYMSYGNPYCYCQPGFSGKQCQYRITEASTTSDMTTKSGCSSNTCRNGGTCYQSPYHSGDYYCICPYGYSGTNCEAYSFYEMTTKSGCSSNTCRNGGTCYQSPYYGRGYYCICPYGYSGTNCEYGYYETTTSSGCSSNPCRNGGSCYNSNYYGGDYFCSCPRYYSGKNCDTYTGYEMTTQSGCSSNPCRNGGTCHQSSYYSRGYYCNCPYGYSGTNCEIYYGYEMTTSSGCSSNPCGNGGTCYNSNYYGGNYFCNCPHYYTGKNCDAYTGYEMTTQSGCSSNPCRNAGTCYERSYYSGGYYCNCPYGYSGTNCEAYITTHGIEDEIKVSCSNNYFSLEINRSWLSKYAPAYYSALRNGKVYFGSCKLYYYTSYYTSDTITRSYSLTSCGTTRQNDYDEIVFTNRLHVVENISDVVTREKLGLLIQCRLSKELSVESAFHVRNASSMISVAGNFSAYMRFSRKERSEYIYSYPASVDLDEELFAHIVLYSMRSLSLRPVIEECLARPDNSSKEEYYLIKDRCVVDSTTRMLGDNETAEFAFKTFDFIRETGPVYIECKIHVCTADDTSYKCTRGCSPYRKKRALGEDEQPITLSEGPFVQETESGENGVTVAAAVGGAVAGVVAVAFIATLIVKIKPLVMATAKVAPAAAGYQPVPVSI